MLNPHPRRRTTHLSTQQVGQEVLIYDELTHKAFCLNAVAAAVWSRCDGLTSMDAIATEVSLELGLPITESLATLTVEDLRRDGLLEEQEAPTLRASVSRRDMMLKMGARAAVLLPIIAVIAAPTAAQAYSGCSDCVPATKQPARNQNTDIFSVQ